jgi:hypothetical protein
MAMHGKAIFLLYKMERSVTTGTGTGTMNNAKAKAKATQSKQQKYDHSKDKWIFLYSIIY